MVPDTADGGWLRSLFLELLGEFDELFDEILSVAWPQVIRIVFDFPAGVFQLLTGVFVQMAQLFDRLVVSLDAIVLARLAVLDCLLLDELVHRLVQVYVGRVDNLTARSQRLQILDSLS